MPHQRHRINSVRQPSKKAQFVVLVSTQEDCLRQLVAAGSTPKQMTWYNVLNFTLPSMWRSLLYVLAIASQTCRRRWPDRLISASAAAKSFISCCSRPARLARSSALSNDANATGRP